MRTLVVLVLLTAQAAFSWAEGAYAQDHHAAAEATCGFDLEDRRFYTFDDFQYFKPPIADIRTPRTTARLYRDEPLPFTAGAAGVDSTSTSVFFDGSFGETFPFMGWNLEPGDITNCMSAAGLVTYFQASAHTLVDLSQNSNPVVNTDYRVGFGLSGRPLRAFRPLAFKLQAFHESTHLGDEYTLNAAEVPAFRRYNVSYEALEALLALDYFDHGGGFWTPAYVRVYGGGRRLTSGFDLFSPWKREFEEYVTLDTFGPDPLLAASQYEIQLGGELFIRSWEADHQSHGHFWKWQYIMGAVDLSRSNLLDPVNPKTVWSTHAMVGVVWGEYFQAKGSNQLAIDWYRGVNPHGQFRDSELEYFSLTLSIRF